MNFWSKMGNELVRAVVLGFGTYFGKDVYERTKHTVLGKNSKDEDLKERLDRAEQELERLRAELSRLNDEPAPKKQEKDDDGALAVVESFDDAPDDPEL